MVLCACSGSKNTKGKSVNISSAGATFPLPYYNLAFKTYMETHPAEITYGGIGSGGGIRSLKDKVVDFAGSDAFLTDEEMSKMPADVIHIPTCMGAVVLVYNLQGVDSLKLNAKIVADVYMGKIKRWSDPAIVALNPNIKLPSSEICPVYRSDGSGTTYVFTYYLSQSNENWAKEMSYGKSLNFKAGVAAKGNPGVAGIVSQTQGTIGYIGSEYAFAMSLKVAAMANSAGNYIRPTIKSISAAATSDIPEDTRLMITNSKSADAYPISCLTWIITYREQSYEKRNMQQAQALKSLMEWMISDTAQALCPKVKYAPLSKTLREKALNNISLMQYNGKAI